MKSDLYTKFVLTVIALALSAIALKNTIPSAFAQSSDIQRVMICSALNQHRCADISSLGEIFVTTRSR